jgi:predicted alpha/beta-fold hydrolase
VQGNSTHPAFVPAWWLPGPQLQTLWPALIFKDFSGQRPNDCFLTGDGDFIDLYREGAPPGPLAILLHGLTGSSRSPYIVRLQAALRRSGWRTLAVNFRGCGGRLNNTAKAYHSGDTGDLDALFRQLRRIEPDTPIAAVGFSLGGNVLLKWLGESGGRIDLCAACAVSVPFRLDLCASRLDRGFSRVYRDRLLQELRHFIAAKHAHLRDIGNHAEAAKLAALGDLRTVRSFWEYDGRVVAPLYGFRDAADYYRQSSSRRFLPGIRVPTLIIHADDDPFTVPEAIPDPAELPPAVRLELTRGGGHVGFVAGRAPGRPDYWLNRRIPEFLSNVLNSQSKPEAG